MVNGSFIAFADGFALADIAAGGFVAVFGADACGGADFGGVCAFAADVISMAAEKQIADTVK
jgi:hypothetical protein